MSILKEQSATAEATCDLCGKEFLVGLMDETRFSSSFDGPWNRNSIWIKLTNQYKDTIHFADGCSDCQKELFEAIQPVLDRRRNLHAGNSEELVLEKYPEREPIVVQRVEPEAADYGTARTATQVAAVIACRKAGAPDPVFAQDAATERLPVIEFHCYCGEMLYAISTNVSSISGPVKTCKNCGQKYEMPGDSIVARLYESRGSTDKAP